MAQLKRHLPIGPLRLRPADHRRYSLARHGSAGGVELLGRLTLQQRLHLAVAQPGEGLASGGRLEARAEVERILKQALRLLEDEPLLLALPVACARPIGASSSAPRARACAR